MIKKHPAVKEFATCPECGKQFYANGLKAHMKVHKPEKENDAMFTVDVVALITRISKLEEDNRDLRAALKSQESEIYRRIEEVQESVYEQIPKLKDGLLLVETSNDKGETVYGQVKPERIIEAQGEQ